MKTKLFFLFRFYATILLTFVVAKLLFFVYNGFPPFLDGLQVLAHGLLLDLNVAAYLSAPLWIFGLLGFWFDGDLSAIISKFLYRFYTALIAIPIILVILVDTILYKNWSFKLDAIVLSYLDNPYAVVESLPFWLVIVIVVAFALLLTAYVALLWRLFPRVQPHDLVRYDRSPWTRRWTSAWSLGLWTGIGALLFLAIRGGVGKSTANIGLVYFSEQQYLNHSAVNPAFSFFYSLLKKENLAEKALFFDEAEAKNWFAQMHYNSHTHLQSGDTLLRHQRPNILLILMESCGGRVVGCTEGNTQVTPHLDQLAKEGVFFSRCYANSFRTDRGMICTFSGYPAFPDVSVMKIPAKNHLLPSIAASLRAVGYGTEFYYGGDKNFTNMNAYFLATGYERVFGDVDFPTHIRKTNNWGVTDHLMFDILQQRIAQTASQSQGKPWFKTLMTLSSHEPWEVPHQQFEDKKLNAFAYLDKSIGKFIADFRNTPEWDNTLIILLPDHGVGWPDSINEFDTRKYHIPMIWTGGAVRKARTIDHLCNQTDLAATLLGQMGVDHSQFVFSRDVLSSTYQYPCALHVWPEGFTLIDDTGHSTYEIATQKLSKSTPDEKGERLQKLKAFMQTAYRHLDALR